MQHQPPLPPNTMVLTMEYLDRQLIKVRKVIKECTEVLREAGVENVRDLPAYREAKKVLVPFYRNAVIVHGPSIFRTISNDPRNILGLMPKPKKKRGRKRKRIEDPQQLQLFSPKMLP